MLAPDRPGRSEWRAGGITLASAVAGYAAGFGFFVFTANMFIEPMRAEFGWTASEATFLPISMLVLATLFPVAGKLTDRYGPRPLAMAGLLGFAVCFLLLAFLPLSVLILRIFAVFLGICCAAAGAVPFGRAIASWFRKNAGFALGIVGSGVTLGGLVGVPFVAFMIAQFGWRWAYAGMACVALLIGLPLVYRFLRIGNDHDPIPSSQTLTEGQEVSEAREGTIPWFDPRFWILFVALTCSGFPIGIYLNHLQPILGERGFLLPSIALLGSVFAGATFTGRIVAGFLLDRMMPPLVAAGCLALSTLGALMVVLLGEPVLPLFVVALILIGLAYGAEADFAAFFALRFFGLARFSLTFGMLAMMIAFAVAMGGFAAAQVVDAYGSYVLAIIFAPMSFSLGSALMLCLMRCNYNK